MGQEGKTPAPFIFINAPLDFLQRKRNMKKPTLEIVINFANSVWQQEINVAPAIKLTEDVRIILNLDYLTAYKLEDDKNCCPECTAISLLEDL
jgi:uncharacterized metal-binding protein